MGWKSRIRQGLEELEKGGNVEEEEDAEIEVSEIVVIPFRVIIDYLGLKASS